MAVWLCGCGCGCGCVAVWRWLAGVRRVSPGCGGGWPGLRRWWAWCSRCPSPTPSCTPSTAPSASRGAPGPLHPAAAGGRWRARRTQLDRCCTPALCVHIKRSFANTNVVVRNKWVHSRQSDLIPTCFKRTEAALSSSSSSTRRGHRPLGTRPAHVHGCHVSWAFQHVELSHSTTLHGMQHTPPH